MRHLVATCLVSAVAACASVPPPAAPAPAVSASPQAAPLAEAVARDIHDRAPAPEGELHYVPPPISEGRLSNGVRVLFIERHKLPLVALGVVSDRGAEQSAPGVCATMAGLLQRGNEKHRALEFTAATERVGARWSTECANGRAYVVASARSGQLPALADLLGEMLLTPTFEAAEVAGRRKATLAALDALSPQSEAERALRRLLYPAGHPYAEIEGGNRRSVALLRREDLVASHARVFTPSAVTIVAAGDVARDTLLPVLERTFGAWKGAAPSAKPLAPVTPAEPDGPRIVVIDRPGASQSTVKVGCLALQRSDPDFPKLLLTNMILGAETSGRLFVNLREKHAYTYGVKSELESRWHAPGPLEMYGDIQTDHTADAIREIFSELRRIREEPVSDDELRAVVARRGGDIPSYFATDGDALGSLETIAAHHLPLDEYATLAGRLASTTKADVTEMANKYLRDAAMRVVVVGDAAKIEPSLVALNLGPVEVRRAKHEGGPKAEPR